MQLSFNFDILVKSSLQISAKQTNVDVKTGDSVNAEDLYTIKQDGVNISINDIPNANITYHFNEQ